MIRKYPFLFNNTRQNSEINLIKNILTESIVLYGQDFVYIKREFLEPNIAFEEFDQSILKKGIPVRMWVEEITEGSFGGPGNIYSKFGLELKDQITVYVSKEILENVNITPEVNDLLYFNITNRLFEITYITDSENMPGVFFPFGEKIAWKMYASLYNFDYSDKTDEIQIEPPEENYIEVPDQLKDFLDESKENLNKTDTEINDKIENAGEDIIDNSEKDPTGDL